MRKLITKTKLMNKKLMNKKTYEETLSFFFLMQS